MNTQKGYSLIELTIIIVIVGILTAVAMPYYYNYTKAARIATLQGLTSDINSAVTMAEAAYLLTNVSPVVTATGQTVTVSGIGIPTSTATGLPNGLNMQGFVYTPGAATGTFNFTTAIVNCSATYTAATGILTLTTTGC